MITAKHAMTVGKHRMPDAVDWRKRFAGVAGCALAAACATFLSPIGGHRTLPEPVADLTAVVVAAHPVTVKHPARETVMRPVIPVLRRYTVRPGDTLTAIAARFLGNPGDWGYLYHLNIRVISDPNLIYPGETLTVSRVIPAGYTPARYVPRHSASHVVTVAKTTPQPGGLLSCAGLERLWEAAGGNPADAFMAAEIAEAESSGNQYATNHDSDGSVDEGYFQINTSNGALATYNALGNARSAVILSDDGRTWSPWVTFQTGAFKGLC